MSRLKLSLATGITIATTLSVLVLLSSLWRRTPTSESYGVSMGAIVITYYAAGIVGGGLVGVVLQLGDNWTTRVSAGLIAAFALFFCIAVATDGWVSSWTGGDWVRVLFLTVVFGGGLTIMSRHDYRE